MKFDNKTPSPFFGWFIAVGGGGDEASNERADMSDQELDALAEQEYSKRIPRS